MNIDKIQTFVETAGSSSYYDVAEKLFTTATTVSKHIHALELEWGMPLFERLPKGVQLTEFGRAALPHAKRILLEYEEILKIPAGELGMSLRIYSIPNQTDFYIGNFMTDFSRTHPDIRISIKDCHGAYVIQALEEGECELAFGGLPFLNPSRVEIAPIKSSATGILLPKAHPLAGKSILSVYDVADEVFTMLAPETGVYKYEMDFMNSFGIHPNVLATRTREASLVDIVESGRAIALFHEISVRLYTGRDVVFVPLKEKLYMEVGLVRVRARQLSPQAETLWRFGLNYNQ